MKAQLAFAIMFSLLTIASRLFAQDYSIDLESNGERIAVIDLSINETEAVAKVGDVTELFDLKNQRWQQAGSEVWVSLTQCELWATQNKEKTSRSTDSIPEKMRPFVSWSLDPTFDVTENDATLKLASGQVDYEMVVTKSDHKLTNYYRYAKLNAYKKAMTEKKLAPFAELKVLEELERRNVMLKSMEIKISGIEGAPAFKMNIRDKLNQPVTEPSPKPGESFTQSP